MYLFTAYNLNISSEVHLPELLPGVTPVDVFIHLDRTLRLPPEANTEGVYAVCKPQLAYLKWQHIGLFKIENGSTLTINPIADVDDVSLRNYIIAVGLNHILFQRGYFMLHASVVAVDGQAVAFVGEKGWGKSTIAAFMHLCGHDVISDDTLAVDWDSADRPQVLPAFPQLKLWPDAVASLGITPEQLPRLFPDHEKRARRLEARFNYDTLPLSRIYVLDPRRHEESSIQPLSFQETFQKLMMYAYAAHVSYVHEFDMLAATDRTAEHLRQTAKVAGSVPARLLKRRLELSELPQLVELVEQDLASG